MLSRRPLCSSSAVARALAACVLGAASIAGGVACAERSITGLGDDIDAPVVELAKTDPPADSMLAFDVNVADNLGIRTVSVRILGGADNQITGSYDTTFTSANVNATLPYQLGMPAGVAPGTPVTVSAWAVDGAGNTSVTDTLVLAVGNVAPPTVQITNPTSSGIAVIGKSLVVAISGKSILKVARMGFVASGSVTAADSNVFTSPLRDSVAMLDTLAIPANASAGPLTLVPFLVDSVGNRMSGPSVALNVQTAAGSNSVPVVTFGVTDRIEVTDTLHVEATDPTGVTSLGYEVRNMSGSVIASDSTSFDGSLTSVPYTFNLRLPLTVFPTDVTVRAFARNSNNTREYATLTGGAVRADTTTVVAGFTRALPNGGKVADALYHPGTNNLYLTNIDRNTLEVFRLADSTFSGSPIIVGSRPWGITAWPENRTGAMGDTLLVANSGGTSISYVNLNTSREVYRYPLPNLIAYTVTSVLAQTGQVIQQRTVYDFSDRPQFVAATCDTVGSGTACGDVILVYSTTPTGGQSLPFPNKGTVRYENLTDKTSHFFFEQAMGQSASRSDTLEIERYAAGGVGSDSLLVPYRQLVGTAPDTARYSIVVRIDELGFRDTTFVRNSANFRRSVIGEGGSVLGSRAMMYEASRGMMTSVAGYALSTPVIDLGVSRPIDVSDFIANAYARVLGVGINFDGQLAAIRGDSTYLIDPTLRLQGLLQTAGGNPGFDFHPSNRGSNSTPLSTRLAFAASSEPVLEIYDTYCYSRVGVVPVRDPIIGPIKAAVRAGTGEIVLVGATARGVVIVSLPNSFTTTCP